MTMSLRKYAKHRGVSLAAVQKAISSGRISQEPDGTLDPQRADAEWGSNTRNSIATVTTDNQIHDYNASRAEREFYAARLARIECEEREGKLVSIDEINALHFSRARRLRDRMLMIPRRLAAQVAAESDARTVEEMLESAICEALEELSSVSAG